MMNIRSLNIVSQRFTRQFSLSCSSWVKRATSAGNSSGIDSSSSTPEFDSANIKRALEETLRIFAQQVQEAKSNTVSSENFANLKIDLGNNNITALKNLATIAARGNKLNIVAFDPKQVKRIQTSIISELGMPTEPSAHDKQTLSVNVPRQNDSKKQAALKLIKESFESLRNNSANRHSLASIRSKYISPLKKAASKNSGVSKDLIKKQTSEIENLIKSYSNKLQDAFKNASSQYN